MTHMTFYQLLENVNFQIHLIDKNSKANPQKKLNA